MELRLVVVRFVFCAVPRTLPSHPLIVVVRGSQWGAFGGCAALDLFPACPPLVRADRMAGVDVVSVPMAGIEARAGAAEVVPWSRGGAQAGRGRHARGKHVASVSLE